MNPELTIQSMFDTSPHIFKDRIDCLNHLFCTIGNGYEWLDGELIDIYCIGEPNNPLKDGKAFQYCSDNYHDTPRKERWYFYIGGLCKDFAYLFNYPEDITPEWKSALEECRQMLIEDGYDV